jgi:hypothetical protein
MSTNGIFVEQTCQLKITKTDESKLIAKKNTNTYQHFRK